MFHKLLDACNRFRGSKTLVVIIACLAIFGDTVLDTVVDPIMPDYLYRLEHPNYTGPIIRHSVIHGNPTAAKSAGHISTPGCPRSDGVNCVPATNTTPKQHELLRSHQRAKQLKKQSIRLGLLYASKSTVQVITNPFVGTLTDRFGYTVPLYVGLVVVFSSTVAYAFSTSYAALFASRVAQGLGSSLSLVVGMAMVQDTFKDRTQRAKVIGYCLTAMILGVLVGPVMGGVMYQFVGYSSPFLLIAGLMVVDGILRLLLNRPETAAKDQEGDYSMFKLLRDPYVLIISAILFVSLATVMMINGILPVWMMNTMNATTWMIGVALVPTGLGFLFGAFVVPKMTEKAKCWPVALAGSILMGLCTLILPLCKNIPQLSVPNFGIGLAHAMVDSSMLTEIGHIADIRHGSRYGRAIAISETSICLGVAVGLGLSGILLNAVGFLWMMTIFGLLNLLMSPVAVFLRNPQSREEKDKLRLDKLSVVYKEANQLETLSYHPQADQPEQKDVGNHISNR